MRGTTLFVSSLLALVTNAVGQEDLAAARARAQALGERYGVRIVFAPASNRYEQALTSAFYAERVDDALDGLERALAGYPRSFLKAAGLREIRLASAARIDGVHVGGHAEPCDGRITLEAHAGIARAFDHELFHVFDCRFFDRVARFYNDVIGQRVIQTYHEDFEWRALNPVRFEYTPDFDGCHMIASGAIEHPLPGFLTWYSTCAIEEDKATLFAHLMDPRTRPQVFEIAKKDRIIAAKVRLIFARLRAFGLELPFANR